MILVYYYNYLLALFAKFRVSRLNYLKSQLLKIIDPFESSFVPFESLQIDS